MCCCYMVYVQYVTFKSLCCIYPPLALDPALVGLSLVYTVSLIGLFQYVIILSTEVEGLVCVLV